MTTTTTSSKAPWINNQSNDPSTKSLEIGLSTMSLTSSVRPPGLSVSSVSTTAVENKLHSVENGRDNDELDYSTCSESGDDESPPERNDNPNSYLSPIGKVTSTHSSPLRRSSSAIDSRQNSDLFGGNSLYFLEVRSSSGLDNKQQDTIGFNKQDKTDAFDNIRDGGNNMGSLNNNTDCSLFGTNKISPGSDRLIRRKDDLSPSSFSNNDFPYTTSNKDGDVLRPDLSFTDNYDALSFSSARGRANSVPTLPLPLKQSNSATEQHQTGGIPPLPATATWLDSNRNNDSGRNKVYDNVDNSSKSLLEGLRMGTIPVEDKSKLGSLPMNNKPAHVKSYSSDLSTNYLFREKNYNVNGLANNSHNEHSTRLDETTFGRSSSREGLKVVNSAADLNSYSQMGANTEFSRHDLRHSLSDIPARGHEYFDVRNAEQDDAIARGHAHTLDSSGAPYHNRGTTSNVPSNGVYNSYEQKEYVMPYKSIPQQQQQRIEYYDNNVVSGNMRADSHAYEENSYIPNRNSHHQYMEDGGGRMDPGNFVSQQPPMQQHNYSESRPCNPSSCPPGSDYQVHSFAKQSSPYAQPAHNQMQQPNILGHSSNAYSYPPGQGDNYGLQSRGTHDQQHLSGHKYPENPHRSHHASDRYRNNTNDTRHDPTQQYRVQNSNYGPSAPRVHASTPPPLAPRASYGEEFDPPARMNNIRANGGHHRVSSFNSAVSHRHGGVPVHQQRMPHSEVVENRVRCHSYGGQGTTIQQEPNAHRGDVLHMYPPRYDGHQLDHRTMILQEPVIVNNDSEFFSAASCGSISGEPNGVHPAYHVNTIPRSDYQSNCDMSASSRCNSFVSVRSEIQGSHAISNNQMNQVPNTLMLRSISNQSNERVFDSCSPPYMGADDYDEVGMPISNMHHPQIVVTQGAPTHFNRPHSNSASSMDRVQGIVPQFVGSELPTATSSPRVVYNIKFKRTQRSFIPGPRAPRDIKIGCYVKVEADRGEDLGFVVSRMPADKFNAAGRSNFRSGTNAVEGIDSPGGTSAITGSAADLKRVVRLATRDEVALLAAKREEEDELLKICRAKVKQRGLSMHVVDAEYQFDRHKLTFFFEAEGRIDFRELVRDLFSIYKTRIWMQQLDKNGVGVVSDNSLDGSAGSAGDAFPPPEVLIHTDLQNEGVL